MLSTQKSPSKHCVVFCVWGRGQRFDEGHLSFSVPLWGGQEQWGFNTPMSHTGRSPRGRQEGALDRGEKKPHNGPQCRLNKLPLLLCLFSSSPDFLSLSLFSPPFKIPTCFTGAGLSDKCQLICIFSPLPFSKRRNAWLSSAQTSTHMRNIFLVLNNQHLCLAIKLC